MPVPLLITPLKFLVRAGSNDGEEPGSTYAYARAPPEPAGPVGPVGQGGPVGPVWFQSSGFSIGLHAAAESMTRNAPWLGLPAFT